MSLAFNTARKKMLYDANILHVFDYYLLDYRVVAFINQLFYCLAVV